MITSTCSVDAQIALQAVHGLRSMEVFAVKLPIADSRLHEMLPESALSTSQSVMISSNSTFSDSFLHEQVVVVTHFHVVSVSRPCTCENKQTNVDLNLCGQDFLVCRCTK